MMTENETGAGTVPTSEPEPYNIQQDIEDIVRGMDEYVRRHPDEPNLDNWKMHASILRSWAEGTREECLTRVAAIHVCVEMLLALLPSGIPMVLQHIVKSQPFVFALLETGKALRIEELVKRNPEAFEELAKQSYRPPRLPPVPVRELQSFGPFKQLDKEKMS